MNRSGRVAAACVLQAALVAVAVAPQLSARLTGEEHLLEVAPVDPVDPFRGAYADLSYPGLVATDGPVTDLEGTVFVPLRRDGEVSRPGRPRADPPADGPYLRCASDGWQLSCGIESLFLPQDEALALERQLAEDGALARIRVDGRGNAAVVAVLPPR